MKHLSTTSVDFVFQASRPTMITRGYRVNMVEVASIKLEERLRRVIDQIQHLFVNSNPVSIAGQTARFNFCN